MNAVTPVRSSAQGSGRPAVADPDHLMADAAWAPPRSSGGREDGGFEAYDPEGEEDEDDDDFWRDTVGLFG